jgi:putative Mn2+ efflux pump MntP
MIPTLLIFGVLAGLDNLQVCSSIGLLPLSRARMRWLAAGFMVCEVVAPLVGILLGHAALALVTPYTRMAGPLMTMLCGAAVLAAALWGGQETDSLKANSFLFALPLSLSLDNLVAGAGVSSMPCGLLTASLSIGLVSGGMSCVGLYGAAFLRRRFQRIMTARIELLIGAYLCVLAVRMLLGDRI